MLGLRTNPGAPGMGTVIVHERAVPRRPVPTGAPTHRRVLRQGDRGVEWVERASSTSTSSTSHGLRRQAVRRRRRGPAPAGHPGLAARADDEVVGRNVIAGRWTFQVVEEFDDTYYEPVRGAERAGHDLLDGRRHVFEAEFKEQRRSQGHAPRASEADRRGPGPELGRPRCQGHGSSGGPRRSPRDRGGAACRG